MACWAGVMNSGDQAALGGMLPHRSTRYTPAASMSTRLVSGEDHSPCSRRCVGDLKFAPASGVKVADSTPADGVPGPARQLHRVCWSQVNATLLRGLTCVVNRICPSVHSAREYARWFVS